MLPLSSSAFGPCLARTVGRCVLAMRRVLALLAVVGAAAACKCQPQSTQTAFCRADWVSHVSVLARLTKQPLPAGSSRQGLNNLKYGVRHLAVYKKPSNVSALPDEVFTPSESPACGLIIDSGKQYLLAGRLENGRTLYTVLCGQVLPDDSKRTTFENVLEWKNVPAGFEQSLKSIKC